MKDFYVYSSNFLAIAAGVTQTNSLIIQADSDFEIHKLCFNCDIGGAVVTDSTRPIPQCTLLLVDTGSGRQLMNQGVDLATIFGNALEPFILSVPKKLRANTALSLALTNYSAATTYNVRLSLIGAKVYGAN